MPSPIATSASRSTVTMARRRSRWRRPTHRRPRTPPRSTPPAPTSGRWPSRASSTMRSCTCASTSRRSAPGFSKRRGRRQHVAAADAALAANAGDWLVREIIAVPQAFPQAPRRERAQPGRTDRARLLLHRHAAGARACGRPELHARRHVRGLERGAGDGAAHGDERRPAADGERALAPCQPLPRR